MSLLSSLLILLSIIISLVVIGLLILWWRGIESLLFPGLGFVVATPVLVMLFLIAELIVVALAIFTKHPR